MPSHTYLLILASGVATVAGHGVAMHTAKTKEDVLAASGHALSFIQDATAQCREELTVCASLDGWEAQSQCLLNHHDDLSWDCQLQMLNVARHMPHAKLATVSDIGFQSQHSGPEPQPVTVSDIGNKTYKGCNFSHDVLPYVWSYHIHFMWNELTDSTTKNMSVELHEKFVKEFQPDMKYCNRFSFLTDLWNKQSNKGPEEHEFAETCMFPSLPPGGPFFMWERGYLISATTFHKVVPWFMANRPRNAKDNNPIGILVHPNTGCQYNDLNHWSMWAGDNKPLFYDILKGCVWAGCEDEVLGCIAFNHLGKGQGYGKCYQAPKSMSTECTMRIEPTSNTSTMECKKPAAEAMV
jgi:hypothetical protein